MVSFKIVYWLNKEILQKSQNIGLVSFVPRTSTLFTQTADFGKNNRTPDDRIFVD